MWASKSNQSPSAWARLKLTIVAGALLVGWSQAGAHASARTAHAKMRDVVSLTDFPTLADALTDIGATATTLVMNRSETLAANTNIPANIALRFEKTCTLALNTGVTLTVLGDVDAGYFRIFTCAGTSLVLGLREIRLEWFGAVGDAVSPTVPVLGKDLATFNPAVHVPTGTDDTAAIQKAVTCALNTEMMSNYLDPAIWGSPNVGPGSQPFWGGAKLAAYPVIVRGRPGAGYLVSGDNILGPQSTRNGKFFFDGQGCSFEWMPAAATDTFIDKLDLIARPVFEDFALRTWGFAGNRGRFVHTANTKQFMNVLRGAQFSRIEIDRGGYYNLTTDPLNVSVPGPVSGNALAKVFHLEGTNLCDTLELHKFQAWGYLNFMTVANQESVAIKLQNCDIGSYYTGAVHFDFIDGYSGGLWIDGCELGVLGSAQTFLRTRATAASNGDFHVTETNRLETRYDNYTIVDAEFGAIYISNINPNFGNPTASANAYSAKVTKWTKTVQFRNCWLPQKLQLWAYTAANYTTYSGNFEPLVYDGVTFPNGVPIIEWGNSNTLAAVDVPALFAAKLRWRDIHFKNSPQQANYCNSLLQTAPDQHRYISFFDAATGNAYVNDAGVAFPVGVLITSIQVVGDATGGTALDRINVAFTSGPSYQAVLSSINGTTTELIPPTKKGVCIVSSVGGRNVITASYYNGAGTPAGAGVKTPARIKITYRSLQGATDLNTASLDPTAV